MTESIRLKSSSIKNVPLHNYSKDFTFFVNGKEFQTSILESELLSPNICKIHSTDPTIDSFTINTTSKGDFLNVLKLLEFDQVNFPKKELPFIFEVFEILGNDSLKFDDLDPNIEINNENVLRLILKQQVCSKYYEQNILQEIEYASMHFNEICYNKIAEFKKLPFEIIDNIINNHKLKLNSEDQLICFINKLYACDSNYSFLYEYVYFENVSTELIKEFASVFDQSDLSRIIWLSLLSKLQMDDKNYSPIPFQRYIRNHKEFKVNEDEIFKGIIYYLQTLPNEKIENNLTVSASSVLNNDPRNQPNNVILYDDLGKRFYSGREKNCSICFDFKDNRVIPTDYTIRSIAWMPNSCHPKSWVIEGSNNKLNWEIIDEKVNCPLLNGSSIVKTFSVDNKSKKEYRFLRMRLTGANWQGKSYLALESFEIYGTLFPK